MTTATTEPRTFMGRNASVLLDVIRFCAAFTVASTHTHDLAPDWHLTPYWAGNSSVCVFFVLSGFVIRYITRARVTTAAEYWIDRASRIYSVVLPALLITMLLEMAAAIARPEIFHFMSAPYRRSEIPMSLLVNTTFISGLWGYGMQPLSNGVFWSLTFEVVYYVVYGVWHYHRRVRYWLAPLILLIAGPSIALMFPTWLYGVGLYELYRKLHPRRQALAAAAAIMVSVLGLMAIFYEAIAHVIAVTHVEARRELVWRLIDASRFREFFHSHGGVGWLERLSPSFYFTGLALSALLLFALLLLDLKVPSVSKPSAHRIRFVADSTFGLYLIHPPIFLFLYTLAGGARRGYVIPATFLLVAVACAILLARPFDRLKLWMRSTLRRFVHVPSPVRTSQPPA